MQDEGEQGGGFLWGLSGPRQGRSGGNVPWTPLGTVRPVRGSVPPPAVGLGGGSSSPGVLGAGDTQGRVWVLGLVLGAPPGQRRS